MRVYTDYLHPSIDALSLRYQAFFNGLSGENVEQETVLEYISLMENKDLIHTVIPGYLGSLREFSRDDAQVSHEGVRNGRAVLRAYFEPKKPMLKKHGLIPVVYGSLQYNKPRNLDYDLMMLADRYHSHVDRLCTFDWTEELNQRWLNDREGHVSYNPLSSIKEYTNLISKDSNHRDIYGNAPTIEWAFSSISVALSGMSLFLEDVPRLAGYRQEYSRLLGADRVIPALVTAELADAYNEVRNRY